MTPPPQRFLTGITTTGTPHLGNYAGSIKPAVVASQEPGAESFYFLADYHALVKCGQPERIQRSTLEIAASWLAAGLDPERVVFYRQSDIPEIPELTWLLTCVTSKGLLNRAHAYKAAVEKNTTTGDEPDADVSAGLFMYPVLMGADILLFKAQKVPVGRDQIQHIEMARDIAQRFNHLYGEHLVLPQAVVEADVALLPGLDGRKMSKSYNNTIPLFAPRAQLKKLIASIVTDSCAPGQAKTVDGSALFQIYQAFASDAQTAALRCAYADGVAWGDVKNTVFNCIDQEIAPMRAHYEALVSEPEKIEALLQAGADKARGFATPLMREVRAAVGLRKLVTSAATPVRQVSAEIAKIAKTTAPIFKQYRGADGQFYFKLLAHDSTLLLESHGFATPQQAAQAIVLLQTGGVKALATLAEQHHVPALTPVQAQATKAALSHWTPADK